MDETAPRRLTKLSFRRDVRIFLTAIGGFFAVLVVVLVVLLRDTAGDARMARLEGWNVVVDNASDAIAEAVAAGRTGDIETILTVFRARHPVVGAEAVLANGARFDSGSLTIDGEVVTRRTSWGTLRIVFDDAPVRALRNRIVWTSAIAITASLGAIILLLLYIPRIVTPIEALLDQAAEIEARPEAVDEHAYLIDTFSRTVATLKQQQEELRVLHDQQKSRADELERVTRALTRGMTSGVLVLDPEGRVVDVNQAGRDILGLGSDPTGDLERVLGTTPFAALVRGALENRRAITREETTAEGATATVTIGVTAVPLHDDTGAFFGMIVLFTDLTRIRHLETRLRESQILADLGEIAAGIAHEFRNSLSAILGYLKLAQRAGTIDAAVDKAKKAESEAAQLSGAVESLLTIARPVALQVQTVDVRALAADLIERLEGIQDGIRFEIEGDLSIEGDPALLARAMQNVLLNAVESIRRHRGGGRIAVVLDEALRTIEVRDDGAGLDERDAARFLLPFHSGKPNGFGLGLALSRKIVVLHGGTIRLSGTPGAGATLTFDFGEAPGAARAATAP